MCHTLLKLAMFSHFRVEIESEGTVDKVMGWASAQLRCVGRALSECPGPDSKQDGDDSSCEPRLSHTGRPQNQLYRR
jgi:hypothetical protein